MKNAILSIMRTSEFWAALAGVLVEVLHEPLPGMDKAALWIYVALRIVSKMVKYVFPNPANPKRAWLKDDSLVTSVLVQPPPAAPAATPSPAKETP